jgi:hypothetical protein
MSAVHSLSARRRHEVDPSVTETPVGRPAEATTIVTDDVATRAGEYANDTAAITAAEHLATIQDVLSLSVTQLAEVLRVARGTVYSWQRGNVEVPRDAESTQRLIGLYRVARRFRARTAETLGRLVVAPLGDDRLSLLALLSVDTWDHAAIEEAVGLLADRLETRRTERQERLSRGVERARPVSEETVELERLRLRLGDLG